MLSLFAKPKTRKRKRKDNVKDVESEPEKKRAEPHVTENFEALSFAEMKLPKFLTNACISLGFDKPTPIQKACIPAILLGKNCIGSAQTGSGKTAAFALPILSNLAKDPYGIYALVLTPSRELAIQIAEQFTVFGQEINLKVATVVGGLDAVKQSLSLQNRPHIVVATPGRLSSMLQNDFFNFSRLKYLVLDEADRLVDGSFSEPLDTVLSKLPLSRKTLLFSATMTSNLARMKELCAEEPFVWSAAPDLSTPKRLKEQYVFMPQQVKMSYFIHVVELYGPQLIENEQSYKSKLRSSLKLGREEIAGSMIVFASTCWMCQLLAEVLMQFGYEAVALHSKLNQRRRMASIGKFKSSVANILVATDVAARGLDIPEVDLVVNYDLPRDPATYVHRVGRTARAGRSGRSVTIVSERDVSLLQSIESHTSTKMSELPIEHEDNILMNLGKTMTALKESRLRLANSGFKRNN